MPLFIIFIVIPFAEIAVFMAVGEHIGLFTTLILAFSTAVIGGIIVKNQGLATIMAMRNAMERGRLPLTEIFDGFCLVAAGALLITPGFITDTAGFLLLIPAIRHVLRQYIKKHTDWNIDIEGMAGADIIEGEYERVENERLKSPD